MLLTLFNARYFRKQNVEIQRFFFYISHYFRHISLVVAVTSVILNLKYNKFVFFVLVHFHLMFKTFFRFICWINIQVIYGVGAGWSTFHYAP